MKTQVITRDNGAGLSKDIQVLREALPDADIDFTPWDRPRKGGRWNWNFHLELVNPQHFSSGTVNALVPNAEWFNADWIRHLGSFDVVLCKTKEAVEIFKRLHKNVIYTGWTSPDPGCTVDYTKTEAVHIAGKSILKGTGQVIEAAASVPDLTVHVVIDKAPKSASGNVIFHEQPTDERMCELRSNSIHVQPSLYEGFGHVVNESRAMGAVIVSSGAAPMSELVSSSWGFLCPSDGERRKGLATEHYPDVKSLVYCLKMAAANTQEHGSTWGKKVRQAYDAERKEFHERIREIVK